MKSASLRVALFLLASLLSLGVLVTAIRGVNTLNYLKSVEAERDRWQKAEEIIAALDLRPGNRVADVGSGVGYFALKLSRAVGSRGRVYASDVRRLPLIFLWIRGGANISVIHCQPDDPELPGDLDAVLIANTYHELAARNAILRHVFRALRPGGRLVVADRGPDGDRDNHEIHPELAETEIQKAGFEIVRRQHAFIHPAGDNSWWLLVGRRPER